MEKIKDIRNSNNWTKVEKIKEGFGPAEKYYVEDNNNKYILRVLPIEEYENKFKEIKFLISLNTLNIEAPEVIDFGICNNGKNVFTLLSWIEGERLDKIINDKSTNEQYKIGRQAGRILKQIHSLNVNIPITEPAKKKEKRIKQIEKYKTGKNHFKDDEKIVDFFERNVDLICKTPFVYKCGDFNMCNLIMKKDGSLGIIDFDDFELGDGYEEFGRLQLFDHNLSIPYSIGVIDEYFNDNPPIDFWKTLAVYSAHSALHSLNSKFLETCENKEEELDKMYKRTYQTLEDYDMFNVVIPKWYSENKGEVTKND